MPMVGNVADLGADGSGLTGGTSPGVLVQTTVAGGTMIGDPTYIQTIPNTTPALQGNNAEQRVIINGSQIPAADRLRPVLCSTPPTPCSAG